MMYQKNRNKGTKKSVLFTRNLLIIKNYETKIIIISSFKFFLIYIQNKFLKWLGVLFRRSTNYLCINDIFVQVIKNNWLIAKSPISLQLLASIAWF